MSGFLFSLLEQDVCQAYQCYVCYVLIHSFYLKWLTDILLLTASVAFVQMLKNLETQDPELVAMSARVREYFLPQLGDPKDS